MIHRHALPAATAVTASSLRRCTRRVRAATLAIVVTLGTLAVLRAHPMPMSGVLLDFQSDHVDTELRLPVDRLEIAFGNPIAVPAEGTRSDQEAALRVYLLRHIAAIAPGGRDWRVDLGALRFEAGTPAVLFAHLRLTPPASAPVRQFTLNYDVIAHEIVTHTVVVAVRADWAGGRTSAEPETLGIIRNDVKSVTIDRGPGGAWRGFLAMFKLGARHIAEGTDHLLFLLTLLLPAPLFARAGRWEQRDGPLSSLRRVSLIVTAFSLGHSLTLAAGAFGWMLLPLRSVEIVIALSVFVSALHALRPVFAGREALIAGGFGLVHGLAFASVLHELQFTAAQLAWSLAGFNLGIEAVQLAVIVATLPWLFVLGRTKTYALIRIGGALFAGTAALGWIAERALGATNPLAAAVEGTARHSAWLLAALAALAIAHLLRIGRSRRHRSISSNL